MNNDWWRTFLDSDYGSVAGGAETAVFMILLAFAIGQFIGWIYMWTHTSLSYSQTYVASLAVMPVLVAVMMLLMAGSMVVAFGLLAVFAVVRFRNVLKDTRDTVFILWSILEGLGVGTMRFSTAVIATIGIGLVVVYLRITSFGNRYRYDAVLALQISGDAAMQTARLKDVLGVYCDRTSLTSQQQIAANTMSISYRVLLRNPERTEDLRSALDSMEGVEDVTLFLRQDEAEI